MPQSDFGNLASPLSGTTFFNDKLEPWRDAVHSTHEGASRPSYAVEGMIWLDTAGTPWILKMFDGTDDITIGTLDATTDVFTPAGIIQNNIAATTAPTTAEDVNDGYSVGSLWVNTTTDLAYLCVDASAGAAIWKQLVDTNTSQALSGKSFASITVTGGSITGITDLAVADGGTGSSTASGARTNLGAAASGANTDISSLTGTALAAGSVDGATTIQGYRPIQSEGGTARTFALADGGKFVYSASGSATVFTIPPNASVAFPIGAEIDVAQFAAGELSIAPGSGVTLFSKDSKRKLNGPYASATLKQTSANFWFLTGDLKA